MSTDLIKLRTIIMTRNFHLHRNIDRFNTIGHFVEVGISGVKNCEDAKIV